MKKMLTNNLGLKLLSVIGAIMLWLIVMNIDDPYTYRDFSPIQVTMLNENVVTDQGKVYKIEDGSDVISIRVWGKKSVLRESGYHGLYRDGGYAEKYQIQRSGRYRGDLQQ